MSMSKFASREDYYKAEIERLQSKLAACGGDNAELTSPQRESKGKTDEHHD